MTMLIALWVLPLVLSLVALERAYQEVNDPYLADWAQAHGLRLTPQNTPMVRWYLRNARVLRTWGVLAGLVLPPLVSGAFESQRDGLDGLLWPFVGYLIGAVYAELALVRPPPAAARRAVLAPRDVAAYLPRKLIAAPGALGVVAISGAAVSLVLPYTRDGGAFAHSTIEVAVIGLAALGAPLIGFGLQRWVVRRSQPFTDADLLAADDAIRSQSLHSVAASCIAIQTLLVSWACYLLFTSDVEILRQTMWVPAYFGWLPAVYACLYYGHRAWRVRRAFTVRASTAS